LNEKHINLFESHGINKLQANKKSVDDAIARTAKRMMDKNVYYVVVSNNMEVAFEILKRQLDAKSCILLEMDMKQSVLHVKEVTMIEPLFNWDVKCGPYSTRTVSIKEISTFI
jgi:predicted Fe-Mo cluster-binding NifX family protein